MYNSRAMKYIHKMKRWVQRWNGIMFGIIAKTPGSFYMSSLMTSMSSSSCKLSEQFEDSEEISLVLNGPRNDKSAGPSIQNQQFVSLCAYFNCAICMEVNLPWIEWSCWLLIDEMEFTLFFLSSCRRNCFLCFIRRFWNQVLTWVSDKCKAWANSTLSGVER